MSKSAAAAAALVPARFTRRVVTGWDEQGDSFIASDSICAANAALWIPEFSVNDAWCITQLPCDNARNLSGPDNVALEPPSTGNVFRVVHIPPDADYLNDIDVQQGFAALGDTELRSSTGTSDAPHPVMHQTDTLDYIVIISGEIYCVMDKGETLLRSGDVLVQRGTNHAWSNRSDQICVMAAVLNGALPRQSESA